VVQVLSRLRMNGSDPALDRTWSVAGKTDKTVMGKTDINARVINKCKTSHSYVMAFASREELALLTGAEILIEEVALYRRSKNEVDIAALNVTKKLCDKLLGHFERCGISWGMRTKDPRLLKMTTVYCCLTTLGGKHHIGRKPRLLIGDQLALTRKEESSANAN
jgi:hypothetical protein